MGMEFRADFRQSQTNSLSPRLQYAVKLLQMSALDFAATLRDIAGKNPFLECDDEPVDEELLAPGGDDDHVNAEAADADAAPAQPEEFDDDRDLWQADAGALPDAGEAELSALDTTPAEATLAAHLQAQASLLPLDARARLLVLAIIESIDDDGYLRTPLEELLSLPFLAPAPTLAEMEAALVHVQSLEPNGVGARGVAECLQLQLQAIGCPQTRALAATLVRDHIQALASRDTAGLARRLGKSPALIEAACDRIRRLDPRPGWRCASTRIDYVVPDVIVKKVRGQWRVQLNPASVPRVRLNRVYAELFARHRSPENADMAGHLHEAKWAVRNVAQRVSTILDVAESIVKRQRHFLEFGAMAMKPLALKEVAEEVGVHESTVSRVTNNKYMATPSGVFELKYFFSRSMVSANGSACSGTAIRGLVKDMIDAEAPGAPVSDAEIARQLAGQGLVVARRTVTKYRQLMRIEPVERRRRHA